MLFEAFSEVVFVFIAKMNAFLIFEKRLFMEYFSVLTGKNCIFLKSKFPYNAKPEGGIKRKCASDLKIRNFGNFGQKVGNSKN